MEEPSARRVKPPPRAPIELSNKKTFSFALKLCELDLQRGQNPRGVSKQWMMIYLLLSTSKQAVDAEAVLCSCV